jgi:predicted Zn-dependent protease
VLEIWSDLLRDADQAGLQLTRVSADREIELGRGLSAASGYLEDNSWQPYVDSVGQKLVRGVRRHAIAYRFHAVSEPVPNAFSLPGGEVYVTTGMLGLLQSEAELAAVLGHEVAHVDLRHCIERYQYAARLKGVGEAADAVRTLVTMQYSRFQELDADEAGVRLSVAAGYDPRAAVDVFERLARIAGEAPPVAARTPVAEFAGAVSGAVRDYPRSHPPSAERASRLAALVRRESLSHPGLCRCAANFQNRSAK